MRPAGTVMTVAFELDGRPFVALNGGTQFTFSEAISFQVPCDSQEEVDHYWDGLAEGGDQAAQRCGWLKDRFGVSWQVVPDGASIELLRDPDAATRRSASREAMLQMAQDRPRQALERAAADARARLTLSAARPTPARAPGSPSDCSTSALSVSQFARTAVPAPAAFPAAARSMIAWCCATERPPGSARIARRSRRSTAGVRCASAPSTCALSARATKTWWKRLSAANAPRGSAAAQRVHERLLRRLERRHVVVREPRDGELGRQRVDDRDDRERVRGLRLRQPRHARVPLRRRLDEPLLGEPVQRLAHRRAAQPEPLAQLRVVELLARRERPVDDRIPQRRVRGIAQQFPLGAPPLSWNRHLTFQ